MINKSLSENDKKQIRLMGFDFNNVILQLKQFSKGTPFLKLNRPATINDGIKRLSKSETVELVDIYNQKAVKQKLMKFIPASGAATRMFKVLIYFHKHYPDKKKSVLKIEAEQGDENSRLMLDFIENLDKFAFYEDLKLALKKDGYNIETLLDKELYKHILDYILTDKGLGLTNLPKGLIKFHRCYGESITAFEEHLAEGCMYVKDYEKKVSLHFTVSPEHIEKFQSMADAKRQVYEKKHDAQLDIVFSVQKRTTDTIAVDSKYIPYRKEDGSILFRQGGHGALIDNLNCLKGDIIFVKNIDNVGSGETREQTARWKKILCGKLISVQEKIFYFLKILTENSTNKVFLSEAEVFAQKELSVKWDDYCLSDEQKQSFLIALFNRPLRVCGMVKNIGAAGGGPFWVEDKNGITSIQIVESAQIDPSSVKQQNIADQATHFNPVDIVCGIRDFYGNPFDLNSFVDKDAVFISQKSIKGSKLHVLELPGLWNGAMAHWNTVFVEVPLTTFNPVKTVTDLLCKNHQ